MTEIGSIHETGERPGKGGFRCLTCNEIKRIEEGQALPDCGKTHKPTKWRRETEIGVTWGG